MNRNIPSLAIALTISASALHAAKGIPLSSLPAAVRTTIQDNLKGAEIKNIGKEKEDGIAQYEVETILNGKSRDFNVDVKGNLLVIEEPITMDAVPTPVKTAVGKKVSTGKLTGVETFQKTGQPMLYEVLYTDSKGKKHEVLFNADGAETK